MDLSDGVLLVTSNKGKLAEIESILGYIESMKLFSLSSKYPGLPVAEDGRTFRENAFIKAKKYAEKYNVVTLADDSGLEVTYLGGRPGVNSARYAGENATDSDLVRKLLKEMDGVSDSQREAVFKCVVCLYDPSTGENIFSEGECRGRISTEPRGDNGFGYDPVFIIEDLNKTMAEIDPALKNRISHRANALDALKDAIISLNLI
ncbi:MAG: RdgB/HAM1 family non-canonical purine NTP pyrophosphatase [Oligoflexia bacterium]|nr:RdgB/HAM1 family non-canonical purine NTP pyrophosphatase [Oligoflexia bacterium]